MEAKGDEVEQKMKNTTVHSRFQFYGIWPNLLEMTSKQATTTAENKKKNDNIYTDRQRPIHFPNWSK